MTSPKKLAPKRFQRRNGRVTEREVISSSRPGTPPSDAVTGRGTATRQGVDFPCGLGGSTGRDNEGKDDGGGAHPAKCGFSMRPTRFPNGSATVATRIPSPTS